MLNKNIAKFFAFVISLSAISACHSVSSSHRGTKTADGRNSDNYQTPQIVGTISSNEIRESSGLAASRCQENVFWTHNDSGDEALVYALDKKGEKLGTWKVSGAKNVDWEDIATLKNENGECFLFIGEIGNNARERGEFTVYRIKEPKISDADKDSTKKNPSATENAESIKFTYPDIRHDAETLMIHPQTGDIYILTKRVSDSAGVYKLKSNFDLNKTNTLKKIADISVPAIPNGLLTGGDISPDGKRVAVCDYFNGYELVLPQNAKNFDEIWKQKPEIVELGKREQGEAICYTANGKSIIANSEKKNAPMIEVKRK